MTGKKGCNWDLEGQALEERAMDEGKVSQIGSWKAFFPDLEQGDQGTLGLPPGQSICHLPFLQGRPVLRRMTVYLERGE